jgi:hypothetical protein
MRPTIVGDVVFLAAVPLPAVAYNGVNGLRLFGSHY